MISPGRDLASVDDRGRRRRPAPARAPRGQLRVADAARAVRLGVVSSGFRSGASRPRWTGTSARPASSSTARVFAATCGASTLPPTHVTADELDLRRGTGVQERERVVDPGVDVEEQRDRSGHRPNPIGVPSQSLARRLLEPDERRLAIDATRPFDRPTPSRRAHVEPDASTSSRSRRPALDQPKPSGSNVAAAAATRRTGRRRDARRGRHASPAPAAARACRPSRRGRRAPPRPPASRAEAAPQQRAPRESDGHQVGDARRGSAGSDSAAASDERGVRRGRPCGRARGAARRLGHRRGVGVDAEDEGGGLAGGGVEHRSTVTRADVDRHPLVAGDEIGDLADVHLEQAASDDEANHARQDTRRETGHRCSSDSRSPTLRR